MMLDRIIKRFGTPFAVVMALMLIGSPTASASAVTGPGPNDIYRTSKHQTLAPHRDYYFGVKSYLETGILITRGNRADSRGIYYVTIEPGPNWTRQFCQVGCDGSPRADQAWIATDVKVFKRLGRSQWKNVGRVTYVLERDHEPTQKVVAGYRYIITSVFRQRKYTLVAGKWTRTIMLAVVYDATR